jgi:H+/Cl- antiporter ClcA
LVTQQSSFSRWLRLLRITSRRSRRQLTFLAGGVAVGAVAVVFATLADEAQAVFHRLIALYPWLPFVLTPASFASIAYVTRRYLPEAKGSGIPQAIAARRVAPALSRKLVSPWIGIGKVVLTLLGLLGGASTGREGPTVQVGAAIMSGVGSLTRIPRAGLILAGSCAGIAAAFNTPLGGIVFGIEEMSQSFERRTSGLSLVAVIMAGLTALAIKGNYAYFGTVTAAFPISVAWLAIPVCGVVGGGLGGLFSRAVVMAARGLPAWPGRLMAQRPILFAALCGLGVAVCGIASGETIFGTGYAEARHLLSLAGNTAITPAFAILKILATLLSTISGIPGGIFSPALAVGAGLGADIGLIFKHADPGALYLMGMVAYLTGVVQAPITAFVIVTEMTQATGMLIPLMATAVIAQTTSRAICIKGVYHALADGYLKRAAATTPAPAPPERPGE